MTATSLPTFTHGLTDAERRAFSKAIAGNLAATVRRLDLGIYEVPSTSVDGETYIVCGVKAGEMSCTCPAGSHGRPCKHVCAVILRRTQEEALRQARKLVQSPASPLPVAAPRPARREVALV